ncbi:hypothetical protein [Myroides odoratus]|uniref:hypothetical protein n=1 Tax=Myroides odoratus TaxID=256 RepID=UPI0039B08752
MNKQVKKWAILCLVMGFVTVLKSCSTEENSRNQESIEQKEINATAISKKWIVTYFLFTKECTSANRLKYQVSSIHLDLNQGRYTALDHYSLLEEAGNWSMKGDTVELSTDKGLNTLKIKINKLSEHAMEAQVLDHQDIIGVELIKKR